ncbi:unnamed protein product, partial [Symbiodinium pilosum]
ERMAKLLSSLSPKATAAAPGGLLTAAATAAPAASTAAASPTLTSSTSFAAPARRTEATPPAEMAKAEPPLPAERGEPLAKSFARGPAEVTVVPDDPPESRAVKRHEPAAPAGPPKPAKRSVLDMLLGSDSQ